MHLFAEVVFYSGQRKTLPKEGYRPDAIFNEAGDPWGITFIAIFSAYPKYPRYLAFAFFSNATLTPFAIKIMTSTINNAPIVICSTFAAV